MDKEEEELKMSGKFKFHMCTPFTPPCLGDYDESDEECRRCGWRKKCRAVKNSEV